MTVSDESASWLLLRDVYHRVRARMPTDRAAQIAIGEAKRSGRLRMRAELREYKARPDLRLRSGSAAPVSRRLVLPIRPTDVFQEWDWEQPAIRQDKKTGTFGRNIVVHRDDEFARWLVNRLRRQRG